MRKPESRDERSESRARGSSRGPIRLESMSQNSEIAGPKKDEMTDTRVTWTRGSNVPGKEKNLDELLGGNFQTLNLDSLGKFSGMFLQPNQFLE